MKIEFIGRANHFGFIRPDCPFPLESMAEFGLSQLQLREPKPHRGKRFRVVIEEVVEGEALSAKESRVAFINCVDERVSRWSEAKQEAFRKACLRIQGHLQKLRGEG